MSEINILIVDDRPENIFTLENILDNGTRKFITAASGKEALQITANEKIDLILLDLKLDDINGIDVARLLRANIKTEKIPIIFATASSKEERKKTREFKNGTVDFLFKPIDLDEANTKVDVFERIIRLEKNLVCQNDGLFNPE
jgi:two-component system, sensor histidine kinase and response regulator